MNSFYFFFGFELIFGYRNNLQNLKKNYKIRILALEPVLDFVWSPTLCWQAHNMLARLRWWAYCELSSNARCLLLRVVALQIFDTEVSATVFVSINLQYWSIVLSKRNHTNGVILHTTFWCLIIILKFWDLVFWKEKITQKFLYVLSYKDKEVVIFFLGTNYKCKWYKFKCNLLQSQLSCTADYNCKIDYSFPHLSRARIIQL